MSLFTQRELLNTIHLKIGDTVDICHDKGSSFKYLRYEILEENHKILLVSMFHVTGIEFIIDKPYKKVSVEEVGDISISEMRKIWLQEEKEEYEKEQQNENIK